MKKLKVKTWLTVVVTLTILSVIKTAFVIITIGFSLSLLFYFKSEKYRCWFNSIFLKKRINAGLYMFDDSWKQIGERRSYPFALEQGTRLPKTAVQGKMFLVISDYYE